MHMLSVEDLLNEMPNHSLAKTYKAFTQRFEELGFILPEQLKFPATVTSVYNITFTGSRARIFETPKPKTCVTTILMISYDGVLLNVLESTPYKINPETKLPLVDTDPCDALFKSMQKMFGSDIMDGLDDLIVKQAHDTNASLALTRMANFGLLTQTAFLDRWSSIKNDFKNALYASRGFHGKAEQETAREYLSTHPLVLNNLAINMKSLAMFETNWIKSFVKHVQFLNKS